MPSPIDSSTELGARAQERLRSERVIWLTTVTPEHRPLPRPVWFLWMPGRPEEVIVYSQNSPRLRNLTANPQVTLNFNGNAGGGEIVVFTGEAGVDPEYPPVNEVPGYVAKYADDLERLDYTPEGFAKAYRFPIRIRLTGLTGH
jgi:PPOX class probable F420-dependent enzyme